MIRNAVLTLTALVAPSLLAAGHDLPNYTAPAWRTATAVTGNGSGFTAAWIEYREGGTALVSRTIGVDGSLGERARVAIDYSDTSSPAIAHSPSDALVVWTGERNVYGELLSRSGVPRKTIALTSGRDDRVDVAVAWNGSRYFVVWSTETEVVGAFVTPDGSSTAPRAIFTESYSVLGQRLTGLPDLAWDGQNFIVVFGEGRSFHCDFTCTLNADQFRVMRISASGDAIDSTPLLIGGSGHVHAHVASSGAESLIALESSDIADKWSGEVTTIVVHDRPARREDRESGLTLDAEIPLFRWYSEVLSSVVWDGATYNVGWRYDSSETRQSWLGAVRVTASGLPFDYRYTPDGGAISFASRQPSIAVDDSGADAFIISKAQILPARLYLGTELAPMPRPPTAPGNVVSYFIGGRAVRIEWQPSEEAAGYTVDRPYVGFGFWYHYAATSAEDRMATAFTAIGDRYRVRAFGPGGLSDAAIITIGMPRHRADRH
jgi:hypothetical protein